LRREGVISRGTSRKRPQPRKPAAADRGRGRRRQIVAVYDKELGIGLLFPGDRGALPLRTQSKSGCVRPKINPLHNLNDVLAFLPQLQ